MFEVYYTLSQITKSQYRCDRCTKAHHKCDRNLPSCTTCLKKSQQCTYLKKKKYKKLLHSIKGNTVEYKMSLGRKDNTEYMNKGNQALTYGKDSAHDKFKINKLPKGYNNPYTPLGIFYRFPKKVLFENMMTLFQFPSPFKSNTGLTLFLSLTEKFGMLVKKSATSKPVKCIEEPIICNVEKLKDIAINNYFEYNNKILPIFLRSQFNFNSKTEVLKMAIIISGISHIEKEEITIHLFEYLSFKLEKAFGTPHRIKPTLENIQALTILSGFSTKLPFIKVNIAKYLSFCQKASDLIGLHLELTGVSRTELIERNMTYSSLTMIYMFSMNHSGSYLHMPYKSITLNDEFNIVVKKIIGGERIEVNMIKDYNYYFYLAMGSYNNNLSSILFSLRLLKEKHLVASCIKEGLQGLVKALIKRIEGLKFFYLFVFSHLNNNVSQSEYLFTQINYQDFILFTHHYLMFYIYSLRLYYPSEGKEDAGHIDYPIDSLFFNKILMECQLCVRHGIQLSNHYLNRLSIACLTQCLVFLLRYKSKNQESYDDVFEKGYAYLKELSKIERLTMYAGMNLNVLDFIGNVK